MAFPVIVPEDVFDEAYLVDINDPQEPRIIDIGGSRLDITFERQLSEAFKNQGDFPKEVAYTTGMTKWNVIADGSYQTTDELEIIHNTAAAVVADLPNNSWIIDLGAANSNKYEPYARAFVDQGKTFGYIALDLSHDSIVGQMTRFMRKFPGSQCVGL